MTDTTEEHRETVIPQFTPSVVYQGDLSLLSPKHPVSWCVSCGAGETSELEGKEDETQELTLKFHLRSPVATRGWGA